MKKILYGLGVSGILCFLLLFPSDALSASRNGLHLWFDTLLPTLLPFMILSNFLIQAGLIRPMVSVLSPLFYRLLRLSPSGTYALVIGFLCGYPMGAKVLADLRNTEQISREEAEYLIEFCNNISPSFIITFLVTANLKAPALTVPTLLILYGAPILWGIFLNPSYRRKHRLYPDISKQSRIPKSRVSFSLIDGCIMDGVATIVKLGGYVMLFAIISGIIGIIPGLSAKSKAVLSGITEITNGIPAVTSCFTGKYRYLLLTVLCSFGGLSAIAQTNSVIKSAHLSLGKYVRSKIIISILAALLTACFLTGLSL